METRDDFNTKEDSFALLLLEEARKRGLCVAFAESCTGGLVCERLTAIPGSSEVAAGGVVSYSNDVKKRVLGVRKETLDTFGAVSVETAREMAKGVLEITGADVAVSVTGIAGPGGGSDDKPVGTVCFGVAYLGREHAERKNFDSTLSRDEIRTHASDHALTLAAFAVKEGVF